MLRRRAFPGVLFLLLCAGCERGCLATWLSDHGVGAPPAPSSKANVPMNGVDCPDGLARCVGGVVEVSRVSHYAMPCRLPPEQCVCPWDSLGPCPLGCAADGVEVVASPERALAQLCAPDPSNPSARPVAASATPNGACDEGEGGYRCVASIVVACEGSDGGSARAVAACMRGCFHDGDGLDDETLTDEAAARILCVR